ncbi:MAG: response regulator [Lachnospiraceae bacterium]|nr:response regulator [Lachnospiraceae bacterium]
MKNHAPKGTSLSSKIILAVVMVLIFSNLIICAVSITRSRAAIRSSIKQRMLDIANCAAGSVNGDMLKKLSAGDVDSPEYQSVLNTLRVFQENVELKYVYGIRDEGNGTFTFTVGPDETNTAGFGEEVFFTPALYAASQGTPSVDDEPYEDAWGRFYSAYSPVFDSAGKVAGIIGVDFTVEWYRSQLLRQTRTSVISFLLVLALIFALAVAASYLIVQNITDPLKKMTEVAKKYGAGDFSEEILIDSSDEVGELSRTLQAMSVSLKEQIERADAANRVKSDFLSNMSHEIRTPINVVLGMNEMILKETRQQSIREYAAGIRDEGKVLMWIVNELFDFTSIEREEIRIAQKDYDTASLITDLIHFVSGRASTKKLDLVTDIDERIPSVLCGDDVHITQIIENLLSNAVKYTKEGQVTLSIREAGRDEDTIFLDVSVKDTGIGIREEDLKKIGEAFSRFDSDNNRSIQGAGLGMAIAARLLELMDSRMHVKSEYGKGSTFSFRLRQKIIDASPVGKITEKGQVLPEAAEVSEYPIFSDARVLAVDDFEMNLTVSRKLLETFGIVPDLAHSGEEALEFVKNSEYDLILLDHMMPDPDGIEVLSIMKREQLIREDTKVIALTANVGQDARKRYLEAGFDDYLSKPIDPERLCDLLLKYLPDSADSTDDIVLEFEPNLGPAEKVQAPSEAEWLKSLPECGIDPEEGLKYCLGKDDLYLEMLKDFSDSLDTRISELTKFKKDSNLKSYRISVHALKSLLKTIGADELSVEARRLEQASGKMDKEYLDEHHPGFLENYEKTVLALRSKLNL